jgi:hypothetical protein
MKLSAQLMLGMAIAFALVCFSVAYDGFTNIDTMADATAQSDARGFAWFWVFLGIVAVASAVASWWMIGHNPEDRER